MDPDECFRISKETLEMMDKFAGPPGQKNNLPSVLQFPRPLSYEPYQPNVLKKAPTSTTQIYAQHTEMDDNPNMPHYKMDFEYMDFNQPSISNNSIPDWNFDDFPIRDTNSEGEDEDWDILSRRAKLNESFLKKQNENYVKNDDGNSEENILIGKDKEMIAKLREQFQFNVVPNAEYRLFNRNPLFYDDV